MHWLSRYFYIEAKIGPSDKRIKTTDHKRNEEILEEFKVEPVDGKLRG